MIKIIKHQGNKTIIISLIEELQDYLIKIDPLKRLIRSPKYGEVYVDDLLEKIKNQDGVIYIAEIDNIPVGMIAGVFEKQTDIDKLECIPSKPARILELIVSEKYRSQGIGLLLMNKIEEYFKKEGVDIIRVEVFEPNKNTHNFYSKSGYEDRAIDMVKKIVI